MFKQIKTKTGLLCMSFGLLLSLMGGDCGGTTTNNDCKAPKVKCGDKCIELSSTDNCGACDNKCTGTKVCTATTVIESGYSCQEPLCPTGQTNCAAANAEKPVCVDFKVADMDNCGACASVNPKAKCDSGTQKCSLSHGGTGDLACLLNVGEKCDQNLGNCASGICQLIPPATETHCVESGGHSCNGDDSICASGSCGLLNKCAFANGHNCQELSGINNCVSGTCTSEKCVGVANGLACKQDSDDVYLRQSCTSGVCGDNNTCEGLYDSTCAKDLDCKSVACGSNATCVAALGAGCTEGQTCMMENTCTNSSCAKLANGKACELGTPKAARGSGCESGACNKIENGADDTYFTCGGKCDASSATEQCAAGYYCKAADGTCTLPGDIGAACTENSHCTTDMCTDKVCAKAALAATCTDDGDCTSGTCGTADPKVCVQGVIANQAACAHNEQCASKWCNQTNNLCQPAPGDSCTGTEACLLGGTCSSGTCSKATVNGDACFFGIPAKPVPNSCATHPTCAKLPGGLGAYQYTCANRCKTVGPDANCRSGECVTFNFCSREIGSPCNLQSDCDSGFCANGHCGQ